MLTTRLPIAYASIESTAIRERHTVIKDSPDAHDADHNDIVLVARGDAAALGRLYDRSRGVCFAAAFQLLRDAPAAEDAVHDAYLRVWRSARSYQTSRGSVRTWLVSITRHAAIDQLRARSVASRCLSRPTMREHPASFDDPAVVAISTLDVRRLQIAIAMLPLDQRQAIELSFFAGLTHLEIATQSGVPLGTVKGRVRLGLRKLRAALDDLSAAPAHCASRLPLAQPVHPNWQ